MRKPPKFKSWRHAVAYWAVATPHIPLALFTVVLITVGVAGEYVATYLQWIGNRMEAWSSK